MNRVVVVVTCIVLLAVTGLVQGERATAPTITLFGQEIDPSQAVTICLEDNIGVVHTLTYSGEKFGPYVVLRGTSTNAFYPDVIDVHNLAADRFALTSYNSIGWNSVNNGTWNDATSSGTSVYATSLGLSGEGAWLAVPCDVAAAASENVGRSRVPAEHAVDTLPTEQAAMCLEDSSGVLYALSESGESFGSHVVMRGTTSSAAYPDAIYIRDQATDRFVLTSYNDSGGNAVNNGTWNDATDSGFSVYASSEGVKNEF